MANVFIFLSDMQAGRSSSTVQVRLICFWETRNVRRDGDLMGVVMILLNSQFLSNVLTLMDFKVTENGCHPNLVKLIGYCLEDEQQPLLYEFMHKGSFEDHLFTNDVQLKPLLWTLCVNVPLDAAKELAFLHGNPVKVIYRDIKAFKILLGSV
ncbi:hypothetical protein Bca4012_006495 [Brassica carinata]